MKKVLFLNKWLTDTENLSYPHQWIGKRFTRHMQLLKEKSVDEDFVCLGLDILRPESADMYIWQENYQNPPELLDWTLQTGKPNILIATEPPVICPENYGQKAYNQYDRIFTWRTDLIDYKKYFPIRPMYFDPPENILKRTFVDREFCVMMASLKVHHDEPDSLYAERRKTADWFAMHHPEAFAFYCKEEKYGVGNPCYKGVAADKQETLSQYKFSICYENMTNCPGYISEKIFDSMYAGCVPIYWGEPNVDQYIPKNCFIDRRDFRSHEEMYEYLTNISQERWEKYVADMEEFLETSEFVRSYQPEAFVETVLKYALKE